MKHCAQHLVVKRIEPPSGSVSEWARGGLDVFRHDPNDVFQMDAIELACEP